MDFFTQYVLTCDVPLDLHVYDGLIHTCARHSQLYFAINVFNCMTLRHGVTPSLNVMDQTRWCMLSNVQVSPPPL